MIRGAGITARMSDTPEREAGSIGQRLQAAMAARGWGQQRLADEAKVAQSTVGNIIAGIREGKESLPLLAEALGVRFRWLRFGDLPREAAPSTWPFEAIEPSSFARLSERQKGEVESALRAAIESIEARTGNHQVR